MNVRFEELMEQVRLAKRLGFTGIAKSCHYSSSPWQEIQQIPFLARAAAEAPGLTFLTSIVLLPLHKPLEIAEQTAALDLFTGGRFILGVGIGYRDVEFKAFGTSRKERVAAAGGEYPGHQAFVDRRRGDDEGLAFRARRRRLLAEAATPPAHLDRRQCRPGDTPRRAYRG